MKTILIPLLAGALFSCTVSRLHAQEYTTHIMKEFTLPQKAEASVLSIYNIFGSIKIEGYAGDKVVMDITETISANDPADVETGKKEVQLGFDVQADTLTAYIAAPYDSRPHQDYNNNRRDTRYRYRIEYTVKVPYALNLNINTVNKSSITVSHVTGRLHTNNVNGSIEIIDAKGATEARTVNGDITVGYASNPPDSSSYHTVNGTIRVNYPTDFSADVQFKSMHGDLYTNFDNAAITSNVVQEKNADGRGTTYKLGRATAVRFGNGGKTYRFQTLNGNVYIKKQS